jgi:hypothetical protein
MRALFRVNALLGQDQPLDGNSANDVRFDNLVDVFHLHASVPDRIGIDNNRLAVLALIEASGFIGAHFAFQSSLGDFVFEYFLELAFAIRIAASSRTAGIALINAYKDMSFVFGHTLILNG